MNKQQLKRRIAVAAKHEKADLVIKNGKIIDVFNSRVIEGDVAIADGMIVGIGNYDGIEVVDAKQRYICPGLIDAHVHTESSLVTPREFSHVVLPHGVTTIITDPHEYANVLGNRGIEFVLESTKDIPLEVYVMLPSTVPASPFECPGFILKAKDLAPLFKHARVLGLAEVMDFPSVKSGAEDMLDKILLTIKHSTHLDGHAAGLTPEELNIYRAAMINTDHETATPEEALERIQRGMYVIVREGAAAKDLVNLLPAITEKNSRRFLFCTDDKHIDDLIYEGSIDYNVRLAIQHGMDPITAIQIASLNAAECYGLETLGAVAPGYQADLVFVESLEDFHVSAVYKKGELVAKNGQYIAKEEKPFPIPLDILNTMHMKDVNKSDLAIHMGNSTKAHIIGLIPDSLYTENVIEEVIVQDGFFQPSIENDQLKIAVVERHHQTGKVGVGIVKGFGIKKGAIASTVAHDSHNLIVVGTNDEDMLIAIQHLKKIGGGLVGVRNGELIDDLQLAIAGLVSTENATFVSGKLESGRKHLREMGVPENIAAFELLAFLSLPVIPKLKLTCNGLFDMTANEFISVAVVAEE